MRLGSTSAHFGTRLDKKAIDVEPRCRSWATYVVCYFASVAGHGTREIAEFLDMLGLDAVEARSIGPRRDASTSVDHRSSYASEIVDERTTT